MTRAGTKTSCRTGCETKLRLLYTAAGGALAVEGPCRRRQACLGRDDFKIATYDIIWKALLGSDVDAVRSEREVVLEWAHAIDQPESVQGRAGRDGRSTHARGVRGRTCFIDLMSPIPGVLHFLLSLIPETMFTGPTIDDVFDELFLLLVSVSGLHEPRVMRRRCHSPSTLI